MLEIVKKMTLSSFLNLETKKARQSVNKMAILLGLNTTHYK